MQEGGGRVIDDRIRQLMGMEWVYSSNDGSDVVIVIVMDE